MDDDPWKTKDAVLRRACDQLAGASVLAPLVLGGEDEEAWSACEVASMAELRLGEVVDPRQLALEDRAQLWQRSCAGERFWAPSQRDAYESMFWLLDAGQRAGTVALARSTSGSELVRLSSLYVLPAHRRRRLATSALCSVRDVLAGSGLAVKLDTFWTVQRNVRFYLELGMWVRMWKRDLEYWWRGGLATPIVEIRDAIATLSIVLDGERVLLARAEREGDRLVAFNAEPARTGDARCDEVAWDAASTLAVHLALHGWPLLAEPASWEPRWCGDAGDPDALAYRIICWEAWAAHHGWLVDAPRVPGLSYMSWSELEAR